MRIRLDARLPTLLAAVVLAACHGSDLGSHSCGSGAEASAGALYQEDVISFTVASLAREDGDGELLRGLGRIAEEHGIADWEAAPATIDALRTAANAPELDDAARARLRQQLAPLGDETIARTFGAQ